MKRKVFRFGDFVGADTLLDGPRGPRSRPDWAVRAKVKERVPELEDCHHCVVLISSDESTFTVGWVDFPDGAVYVTMECEA